MIQKCTKAFEGLAASPAASCSTSATFILGHVGERERGAGMFVLRQSVARSSVLLLRSSNRHGTRALALSSKQPELSDSVQRALEGIVGAKSITVSQAVREQHCRDESYHADADGLFPPQAVVFPKSTHEVQEIVRLCARDKIPIVASGAWCVCVCVCVCVSVCVCVCVYAHIHARAHTHTIKTKQSNT